jgi:hypothetical protein
MKTLVIIFSLLLCCSLCAQKRLFVRVYDLAGKKITSGRVLAVTDTMLLLKGTKIGFDTVFVQDIGFINTKHSVGRNIGIGIAIGAVSGVVVGLANSKPNDPEDPIQIGTQGEVVVGYALLGMSVGTLVGGISGAFKNSKHFPVHRDVTKWREFEIMVADYNTKHNINEYN